MIELLFILLPVAAAYGYYMGRSAAGSKRQADQHGRHTRYMQGIEYLLSHEQERAVDQFIVYLNESAPSVENSLALGNLFRSRGEFDKAIGLHEALASDGQLEQSENELASMELARDFVAAGLMDRAEHLLREIIDIPHLRQDSVELLLSLYEQERDYQRAIAVALEYRESLSAAALQNLSHYYCEVAEHELAQCDYSRARSLFGEAVAVYARAIRPRIGLCRLELRQHAAQRAYALLQEVVELDPGYGLLYLELLQQCFPDPADPRLRTALTDLVRRSHSAAAMARLVEVVGQDSWQEAEELLYSFIKEKPNLKLFSQLMRLRAHDHDAGGAIMELKSLMDAEIARRALYTCRNCGFESKLLFWQCPSCRRWEALRTTQGLDGD